MIASEKIFLRLKHTILLNILLVTCPCVRNTRDNVLVHGDLFRPENQNCVGNI